jgi:CBS domain containing-hemolysin-like protein
MIPKDPDRVERQLQRTLAEGENEGVIDPYSARMIRGVLTFRDRVVKDVMIPRTEMVAVPEDAAVREIQDLLIKHGYTRLPVYSGTIDNIIGILNVKDLLKFLPGDMPEGGVLTQLKKPFYIPETKNVNSLLHEFKRERHHMAIVMDEYGGTSGLVTIEDLIEEIVGEIFDEYDGDEKKWVELPDGAVLMDGRIRIEDAAACLDTPIPEGKYETLGGFILHLIRKIPAAGEKVAHGDLDMIIEAADERSIRKIRITKRKEPVMETGAGGTKKSHE